MLRYGFVVLLCCVSSIAFARDVKMHGANGDGGSDACPDAVPPSPVAKRIVPATSHNKVKAPANLRGGSDDGSSHAPRWHSFLPGMFR